MADTLYTVIYKSFDADPGAGDVADIIAGTWASGVQFGSTTTTVSGSYDIPITGLASGTQYKAAFVWSDGNVSTATPVISDPFTTDGMDAFETGNVTTFSGDATAISFTPELSDSYEYDGTANFVNKWAAFGARFTQLNGAAPTFTVDYSDQWNTVGGLIRPVFSYNQNGPWTEFDNYSTNGSAHVFSHNSAFTSDTVYVCSSAPLSNTDIADWVTTTVATSQYSDYFPSDTDNDWVLLTQAGGTTKWGKTEAAKPVYGFVLTDSANTPADGKRKALLMSGLHAFESSGTYTLKSLIDWLLAGSADALAVLEAFEFYVVPLANPVGRDSGTARAQFEATTPTNLDPNRDWNVASSKTNLIGTLKTIFETDVGPKLNVFLDFHGYGFSSQQFKFFGQEIGTTDKSQEYASALYARYSTNVVELIEAFNETGTHSRAWAIPSRSVDTPFTPVELALTPETTIDWPVSTLETLGQHFGGALLDRYQAGDFQSVVITGDLAATETGSDTAAVTGGVGLTGALAVQEVGSDTAAVTGGVTVTGSLAVQEVGVDALQFLGEAPELIEGLLAGQETGADTAVVTGGVLVSGTLNLVESGADAANVSGQVEVTGTLAAQETGVDTLQMLGAAPEVINGTLAAQETGNDTAAVVGQVHVEGFLQAVETGQDALNIIGDAPEIITGVLAATEAGSDTANVLGALIVTGVVTAQEGASDTALLTGSITIQGVLSAQELGSDTAYISEGLPQIIGSLTAQEAGQDILRLLSDPSKINYSVFSVAQRQLNKALVRIFGEDVVLDAGGNAYPVRAFLEWPTPDRSVGNAMAERPQPYLMMRTASIEGMELKARQEIQIRGKHLTAVSDPMDDGHGMTVIYVRGTL